jgi:hypothetical protein
MNHKDLETYDGRMVCGMDYGRNIYYGAIVAYQASNPAVVLSVHPATTLPYTKMLSSNIRGWIKMPNLPEEICYVLVRLESCVILPPPPNNTPDDCLECGAKNDDPCKDGCPNKEDDNG